MQIALKSLANFKDLSINDLATECVRLQLAGVECYSKDKTSITSNSGGVNSISGNVDTASLVDSITESVLRKLQESSLNDAA